VFVNAVFELRLFVIDGRIVHRYCARYERVEETGIYLMPITCKLHTYFCLMQSSLFLVPKNFYLFFICFVLAGRVKDWVSLSRSEAVRVWCKGDVAAMEDAERQAETLAVVWTKWLADKESSAQGNVPKANARGAVKGERRDAAGKRSRIEVESEIFDPIPAIRLDFLVSWSPERKGEAQVHTLEVTECGFSTWSWVEGEATVFKAVARCACRSWLDVPAGRPNVDKRLKWSRKQQQ
jgi:hypothetical protein